MDHHISKDASRYVQMNDDPETYGNNNGITRSAAIACLEKYAPKLKWRRDGEVICDIGPGDGSVTGILKKYIPRYEKLTGFDVSEKMVEWANEHYADETTEFKLLDVMKELPSELRGSFDHVFSFSTFHWLLDQEKAFTNVYNLLNQDGECLVTFFAHLPTYALYLALSRTKKWGPWLTDCDKMTSPYHQSDDPVNIIYGLLKKIGFQYIDVKCIQKKYTFKTLEEWINIITTINPFKFPDDLQKDLEGDLMQVGRDFRLVDDINNTVTYIYNLLIIHCRR